MGGGTPADSSSGGDFGGSRVVEPAGPAMQPLPKPPRESPHSDQVLRETFKRKQAGSLWVCKFCLIAHHGHESHCTRCTTALVYAMYWPPGVGHDAAISKALTHSREAPTPRPPMISRSRSPLREASSAGTSSEGGAVGTSSEVAQHLWVTPVGGVLTPAPGGVPTSVSSVTHSQDQSLIPPP